MILRGDKALSRMMDHPGEKWEWIDSPFPDDVYVVCMDRNGDFIGKTICGDAYDDLMTGWEFTWGKNALFAKWRRVEPDKSEPEPKREVKMHCSKHIYTGAQAKEMMEKHPGVKFVEIEPLHADDPQIVWKKIDGDGPPDCWGCNDRRYYPDWSDSWTTLQWILADPEHQPTHKGTELPELMMERPERIFYTDEYGTFNPIRVYVCRVGDFFPHSQSIEELLRWRKRNDGVGITTPPQNLSSHDYRHTWREYIPEPGPQTMPWKEAMKHYLDGKPIRQTWHSKVFPSFSIQDSMAHTFTKDNRAANDWIVG